MYNVPRWSELMFNADYKAEENKYYLKQWSKSGNLLVFVEYFQKYNRIRITPLITWTCIAGINHDTPPTHVEVDTCVLFLGTI